MQRATDTLAGGARAGSRTGWTVGSVLAIRRAPDRPVDRSRDNCLLAGTHHRRHRRREPWRAQSGPPPPFRWL